jgi:uncharacterized protein (TIGR03435 family)
MRTKINRAQRTTPVRSESKEQLAVGIFGGTSLGDRIEILLKRGPVFSPRVSALRVGMSALVLLMFTIVGSRAPRWIAFAQEPDRPAFEVASIKPGDPSDSQVRIRMRQGGRFTTNNASLQMLIGFAYDVRNYQISGGPNWMDSAKFNVEAKAGSALPIPVGPGSGPMQLMVQSLLADRFKLKVHKETREEQVYELVEDKRGSKLKEAAALAEDSPQGLQMGRGQMIGMAAPMALLARQLSQLLGRTVIDKTGLTGKYEFTLHWTPDPGAFAGAPGGPDAAPQADLSGPSLSTAVQEDLGLKLASAKGPVEMLVIDHVERPSEN